MRDPPEGIIRTRSRHRPRGGARPGSLWRQDHGAGDGDSLPSDFTAYLTRLVLRRVSLAPGCTTGTYAVISYMATARTREFAIRVALGADRATVMGLVVRQGLGLTVAGLVAGTAARSPAPTPGRAPGQRPSARF